MSEIFAASKGCVYVPNPKGGSGSYALQGLSRGSLESPVLILGAGLQDADIILPTSTLNGEKILYTFGTAWGDITVSGVVLLGNAGDSGLTRVRSWFDSNRTSAGDKAKLVNVSTPAGPYKMYVNAMGLGQPDPVFNTQLFMIYGKIANPKK